MSEDTAIEWADDTFNPWWGCSRVSPGCVHCYADTWAKRTGADGLWRRHGPRRIASDAYWAKPNRWNREAQAEGRPRRIFCASMADVFEDHPSLPAPRARLWELIDRTPWLTWMLLTKRIGNVLEMAPWGDVWPSNVWIGTSVEDQRRADERIPILLRIPAVVQFLSCEPLLGPVDLDEIWPGTVHSSDYVNQLDWVIVGGESGPGARAMHPDWARSLRDQCTAAGVAFFFKQWGAWSPNNLCDPELELMHLVGKKAAGRDLDGRTWDEMPAPLAVVA